MSTSQQAPPKFEKWWQKWGLSPKKLSFQEARKALEELENLVEDYFAK
jgi:hypothetical protein